MQGLVLTVSLEVAMRRVGGSGEPSLGWVGSCRYAAKPAGRDRAMVDAQVRTAPPVAQGARQ